MADTETAPSPEVQAAMIGLAPLSDDTKEKLHAELERINRVPDGWVAPDPIPAADRIRAFEEEAFKGSQIQVVRIGDRLERGAGSAFAALSPELRRLHAALEKLVAAEQKLADAHAALIQADVEHEAALAAAEPKPDAE